MSPSVDLSPVVEIAVTTAHKSLPPVVAAVTVDFDKSVLIQMALFSFLIIVLKPLLLDPMLRVFAQREERTEGAKLQARSMQERAAEILTNYEGKVAKVRAEAMGQRDAIRKETAQLEAQILADARENADAIVTQGRVQIAQEISALESDLTKMSQELAQKVAGRVIGREMNS